MNELQKKIIAVTLVLVCGLLVIYGVYVNNHSAAHATQQNPEELGFAPGLTARYYSAYHGISRLPESESALGLSFSGKGTVEEPSLADLPKNLPTDYAAAFEGFFCAEKPGTYTFAVTAPAGFLLRVGAKQESFSANSQLSLYLPAGYHAFYLYCYATTRSPLQVTVREKEAELPARSLFFRPEKSADQPTIFSLSANKAQNPQLSYDLQFSIEEDGAKGLLLGSTNTQMVLTYSATHALYYNGQPLVSGVTAVDFAHGAQLSFDAEGENAFPLRLEVTGTDLPAIFINTLGNANAGTREYVHATMEIMGGNHSVIDYALPLQKTWVQIKGRGNFTYGLEKKPYQIKFYNPTPVLDLAPETVWCLIPSHTDTSLERNKIAFDIGKEFEHLAFTPNTRYVDVYVNGDYRGLYLLIDKITIGPSRLDLATDIAGDSFGYILEMEGADRAEGTNGVDYFLMGRWVINFKKPDGNELSAAQRQRIRRDFTALYNAVISGGDWKSLMNMDSFIDWYLMIQLFKCWDAQFNASIYFYQDAGGKFNMGPLWDFDQCMGNQDMSAAIASPVGWELKEGTWFTYLLQDEEFKSRLIERYFEKREVLGTIPDRLRGYMALIEKSYDKNFEKYPILGKGIWPNTPEMIAADTQEKQVQLLIDWIEERLSYMDAQLKRGLV